MKINDIGKGLKEAGYISSLDIDFAVAGAIDGTALLVEGQPGVGKSCLAEATAKMLGLPLLRVQFYEGLTYDKILYDYDYQRQLLTIQSMQSVLNANMAGKTIEEALDIAKKIEFFGKGFLIERPILKAISGKQRYVLLLDEIDKASEEIEYTLLEVLENYSLSIPQYGTVTCPADMRPITFLTSNNYRELSDALKRRCNYLYIQSKTKEEIREIMKLQTDLNPDIAEAVAANMAKIAGLNLRQMPSISEAISWARYLTEHDGEITRDNIRYSLCNMAKNPDDAAQIRYAVGNGELMQDI